MGRPKKVLQEPVKSAIKKKTPIVIPEPVKPPVIVKKKSDFPIPVDLPDTTLKVAPVVPKQPKNKQRLPDPFEELPEKTRSYLRLEPYGNNIIIDKVLSRGLLEFFRNIKDLPLPESLTKELNIHQDKIRKFLGFISIAEHDEYWKNLLKENWEPFYPNYKCSCSAKKTKIKKGTKESSEDDE